jgi:hypothetical protein
MRWEDGGGELSALLENRNVPPSPQLLTKIQTQQQEGPVTHNQKVLLSTHLLLKATWMV